MKKVSICICILILFGTTITAETQQSVTLSRCIDGDTAAFLIDGKEEKVRFLAIDTPESTNKIEPYGKKASRYTCDALEQADTISLEYEEKNKRDKYQRLLAWVFVDDVLLQDDIVHEGLAEVAYIYGEYQYTDQLYKSQKSAKKNKMNIWGDTESELFDEKIIFGLFGVMILFIFFFQKKGKKKTMKRIHREMKKYNK